MDRQELNEAQIGLGPAKEMTRRELFTDYRKESLKALSKGIIPMELAAPVVIAIFVGAFLISIALGIVLVVLCLLAATAVDDSEWFH